MNGKSKLTVFVKLSVTVAAILWIVMGINWTDMAVRISDISWPIAVLSFAVYSLWLAPCAWRWVRIAGSCGYDIKVMESLRGYLVGGFFGSFLPTGRGGDVVRGVLSAKTHGWPLASILSTILVERMTGLGIAAVLTLTVSLLAALTNPLFNGVLVSAAVFLIILAAAASVAFTRHFRIIIAIIVRFIPFEGLRRTVDQAGAVMCIFADRPRLIALPSLLSLLNVIVLVMAAFVMGHAIPGFTAPWYSYWLVIPLNFLSLLLPSVGGYGVREAGFIVLFSLFGVPREAAAVFAILQMIFATIFAIAGGVVFALSAGKAPQGDS
ncbi:MAG: lysylphosphatidylglycerol synthase transmembrane domain-containing protein [bacterium]